MIIDGIRLYSATESFTPLALYAEFSLDHADTSQSYILQQVGGLDLDEITPNLYGSYGENDLFMNMVAKDRQIVLKIRLNPQPQLLETASGLRDALYKLIAAGRTGLVELRLMNLGESVAYIRGRINKFENDLFSPETFIQISIHCEDPIFRGLTTVNAEDEVGFSKSNAFIIDDISTAPHGMHLVLTFSSSFTSPFIIQGKYGTTEWPFRINRSFITGDILHLINEGTKKVLQVYPAVGSSVSLLDKISINQVWPMIFPGENRLGFPSSAAYDVTYLTYIHHFWGV